MLHREAEKTDVRSTQPQTSFIRSAHDCELRFSVEQQQDVAQNVLFRLAGEAAQQVRLSGWLFIDGLSTNGQPQSCVMEL